MTDDPERPSGAKAALVLGGRTARATVQDRIIGLGAEVAFFTILSLPPALLAIFGTIGYVGSVLEPGTVARLHDQMLSVASTFLAPQTVELWLEPTLDDLLAEGRADIVSIGIILAVWSSSRAVRVLNDAVAIAYGEPDNRSGLRRRLVALGMTVAGMATMLIMVPLLVAGPRIGEYIAQPIGLDAVVATLWRVLYWPVAGVLGVVLLASFYHFAPPRGTSWLREFPGAVVAAVLWLAGAAALRVYIGWTVQGETVYGPLATPIAILLWLFLTALAILVGAELNAEIDRMWPSQRERRHAQKGRGFDEARRSDSAPRTRAGWIRRHRRRADAR